MRRRHLCGKAAALSLLATVGCATCVLAEPITYQGRLTDASLPATGTYEMLFRVYDAATDGTLLATAPIVTVSTLDGLVTATLDIPAATFTGATVYIDISLRPVGATTFVQLDGRQQITPAPLAMRSLNERWSIQTSSRIGTDSGIKNVLINESTPIYTDAVLSITQSASGASLGGMYVNTTSATGVPYYGWAVDHGSVAEARVNGATGTFVLRNLDREWVTITSEGHVGIGTASTAAERLRVNGNIYSTAEIIAGTSIVSEGDVVCEGDATVSGDANIAGNALVANDVRASGLKYHSYEDRAFIVSPEAFHPVNNASSAVIGAVSGISFFEGTVGPAYLTAPVYLPASAYISGIDAFVLDNSAAANLNVQLLARSATSSSYLLVASVDSTGASASVATISDETTFAPVDPHNFTYVLYVHSTDWQGSSMGIKGVRVRYQVIKPD